MNHWERSVDFTQDQMRPLLHPACSAFREILNEPIPKSTLSLHFRILREAGLIRGERRGVEMLNSSRFQEVDARFPGLLAPIVNAYKLQIAEREAQSKKKKRVYVKKRTQG